MSIIEDLRIAVDNYETDNCKTEIVNFEITGGGGTVLNETETFMFRVRVTNQSHLDMKNVTVRVSGTSFADVAFLLIGPFGRSAVSRPFNLDAHQVHTTLFFRGKCKRVTNGTKDIVTARINSWDASFDHILRDHTGAGAAEGKLNKEIHPN
ncbi:hypothetical protein [Desulfonema magnum]|uniref:Uncharacterized protein n=1 Tax=Desulfonema magnum TaxID=45655 RepID=A0A975BFB0_9BACT|nr:hypothetical protein [Desulfonema magnum]QTA84245.1 Uncharacterized protein dnm_002390 [Desulfonema magnum]